MKQVGRKLKEPSCESVNMSIVEEETYLTVLSNGPLYYADMINTKPINIDWKQYPYLLVRFKAKNCGICVEVRSNMKSCGDVPSKDGLITYTCYSGEEYGRRGRTRD